MKINIQNHKTLIRVCSMMLLVCMMAAMLVVPASAAETEVVFNELILDYDMYPLVLEILELDLQGYEDYKSLANYVSDGNTFISSLYVDNTKTIVLIDNFTIEAALSKYNNKFNTTYSIDQFATPAYTGDFFGLEMRLYKINFDVSLGVLTEETHIFTPYVVNGAGQGLTTVVTKEMLSNVLNEVVALLPVFIAVMIGFIGLRKGISFLQSVLHSA